MLIVGLTGGIGAGKTTVGAMFRELGVPVYNSDSEARRLMQDSARIREKVTALLGREAYKDGVTNRTYIASRVFGNKKLLDRLNVIIHPEVREDFKRWVKQSKAPYVIQEAAILFENGAYTGLDRIILVQAPREVRIERVMERDGNSRTDIEARMAHQWDDSRKVELSDFTIENLDPEITRSQVREIHRQLLEISG